MFTLFIDNKHSLIHKHLRMYKIITSTNYKVNVTFILMHTNIHKCTKCIWYPSPLLLENLFQLYSVHSATEYLHHHLVLRPEYMHECTSTKYMVTFSSNHGEHNPIIYSIHTAIEYNQFI
jgi:hypothetical protein